MPTFLLRKPPSSGGVFEISPGDLRHLTRVLRIKPGETFEILLPDQERAQAVLEKIPKGYRGKVVGHLGKNLFQPLPLWLAVGLIRWPRMDWLVEKATEVGVQRITPLQLHRSRFQNKHTNFTNKINRLKNISKETLKQCQGPRPVDIDPPQTLKKFLDSLQDFPRENSQRIIFHPIPQGPQWSPSQIGKAKNFIFLIGSEGGWVEEEISLALAHGFESFTLGPSPLRTETAALFSAFTLKFAREERESR